MQSASLYPTRCHGFLRLGTYYRVKSSLIARRCWVLSTCALRESHCTRVSCVRALAHVPDVCVRLLTDVLRVHNVERMRVPGAR